VGGAPFNNLLRDRSGEPPRLDFVAHARALGAFSEKVQSLAELEAAVQRAVSSRESHVIVIETNAQVSTRAGGAWWDVPVAEVSPRDETKKARRSYEEARRRQRLDLV
jgi:3D-(3,5/4)-trihydroxycyclohexane-1,2-dione acylhydrolase (decyclizing)